MRMFRYLVIGIVLVFAFFANTEGQISGQGDDKDTVTSYSSKDIIFVYNQSPAPKLGILKAANPHGTLATFEWSRYDTTTLSFSAPFQTDVNLLTSTVSNLADGGYKVKIRSVGFTDTTLMAWVYLNDYTLALNKDVSGNLKLGNVHCDYIDLISTSQLKNFTYFDTLTKKRWVLIHKLKYSWSANPELTFSYSIDTASRIRIKKSGIVRPPAKDTRFTLNTVDRFNLSKTDNVLYKTIQTLARFRLEWPPQSDKYDKDSLSAPLQVSFIDSSENAVKYKWNYGTGNPKDTALSKFPKPYVYIFPKKNYTVTLITQSPAFCVDTSTQSFTVARSSIFGYPKDSSNVTQPNVFVARGGNTFKVYFISLRAFHIEIFSRWGKVVYQYDGADFQNWDGWDGTIGGLSSSEASQGIYYYVIKAITWDSPPIHDFFVNSNGIYKGFFYLFR